MLLGIENQRQFNEQRFNILQSLLRLRQICCHPGLIDPTMRGESSAKLEALFDLLEPLRVPGREPREHDDPHDRDQELERLVHGSRRDVDAVHRVGEPRLRADRPANGSNFLHERAAIPALEANLKEKDGNVRGAAAYALRQLKGR